MKLVRVFFDVDMRNQHDGLGKLAKKEGVDTRVIADDEHIVFINTKMNRLKMLSRGGVLSYWKSYDGTKVNMEAIQYIPDAFQAGKINYSKALEKLMRQKMGSKS